MFRFAHIEYLNALYLLPVLVLLYWYLWRKQKKRLNEFAKPAMHRILFPLKSRVKPLVKFGILMFAYVLLVFAIANPQIGSKIEEVKQVGIDVYILLDVSLSMTAQDIKPSRLEKAKHDIAKLIRKLRGDRIGLIVFSGQAYVQIPLTTDYAAANLFLSAVDVSTVPQPGTAIGPAIELAMNSFKKDDDTKKAIIVITDGEDHEGDLDKIIPKAVEKGIQLYAIGLGSPAGVPIPLYDASGKQTGYKKDRYGKVVLTKLDEATLRKIAEEGNGKYYLASNNNNELEEIYKDLAKIEKSEFGATKITDYEDRFYFLLAPAIFLLFLEFFIGNKKSKLIMKLNKSGK
ncbi:MAG: VWA domain-containing protein [Chlorobi bacterium]|nr:VWA domain-containing protein [Chlorobiota bacterium]